jgi:hypothetical protein
MGLELLPKLGYVKKTYLMNTMIPGLSKSAPKEQKSSNKKTDNNLNKMSSSTSAGKIDLLMIQKQLKKPSDQLIVNKEMLPIMQF